MTEIAFHFNIPDKLPYVCRLLRKATAKAAGVVVLAQPEVLRVLDQRLWELSATDFVGHVWLQPAAQAETDPDAQAWATLRRQARVLLASTLNPEASQDVLVNLLPQVPDGFEQFAKLVEIVSLDDNERAMARDRWRHYSTRGYHIQRHDVQVRS